MLSLMTLTKVLAGRQPNDLVFCNCLVCFSCFLSLIYVFMYFVGRNINKILKMVKIALFLLDEALWEFSHL